MTEAVALTELPRLAREVRRPLSTAVADELRGRNAPLSEAQSRNLTLLTKGEAVCVVTGQQLGLFLGPVFTFYKVLSLLAYTERLTEALASPVVPIFWMQSEDHDLREAAQIGLLANDGSFERVTMYSDAELESNRRSVGSIPLPVSIGALRERLAVAAGVTPEHAALEMFFRHYRPGATFSGSFSGVLQELFAASGLLVFDTREPAVRRESAPVFEMFFNREAEVSAALEKRTAELEAAECGPLVHVKSGSPLFFFHPEGPDGPRYRLERAGSSWSYEGGASPLTPERVLELIRSTPGSFSTSALLRPVLQNTLLPVVAYVAGPAEEKYWRQVEPLSQLAGRAHPLVLPRLGALILEPKPRRFLDQLGLPQESLLLLPDAIANKLLAGGLPEELSPEGIQHAVQLFTTTTIGRLLEALQSQEPAIAAELARSAEKIERAGQGFVDKFRETLARRRATQNNKLSRLLALTHPGGVPQERACAFAPFWCTFGERLTESVLEAFRNRIRTADAGRTVIISLD